MPISRLSVPVLLLIVFSIAASCSTRGCGGASAPGTADVQPGAATGVGPIDAARPSAPPPADDGALAVASAFLAKAATAAAPASGVDATAESAGADPAALFALVHDRIRTQIYRGVLRGSEGTLMGAAGNAWDQSVLLAAMLRHHHREVRFAHAHLAPDAAAKVVDRMFADAARGRTAAAPALTAPDSLQQQGRMLAARIQADWRRAGADLLDAIDRAHVTLGDAAVTEQTLAAEAADHLFVEYRDGDQWIALDPAGASAPGASAAAAEERFADVPDSAYHHVTIRVWIEQRRKGALETKEVLRYPATAAELDGEPVVLSHRIDRDVKAHWRATPLIHAGPKFYAARTFNETGLVGVMPKTKEDLIGQAHDAVRGLGAVTDAFGGGDAKPAPAVAAELTAEWLEVEFVDPAKQSVVVRRDLVDRIGIVARANGSAATAPLAPIPLAADVPLPFAGVYASAFASGPLDAGRPLHRVRTPDQLAADLQALRSAKPAANGTLAPDDHARFGRVLDALPSVLAAVAENTLIVSQRLEGQAKAVEPAPLFYENSPRMVIASFEPLWGGALDLRRDMIRTAGRGMSGTALARASLDRAAADAAIEGALLGTGGGGRLAAVDVFDRARAEGIRLVAVRGGQPLSGMQPTAVARARMASSDNHALLVAPERTPSAAPQRFAWWQIDPSTGDGVTVLETGLHGAQDLPEYAQTQQISALAYEVPPPTPISPLAYEVGPPMPPSPLAYNVARPWGQCVEFTGEMMLELIRALTATGNL